MGADSCRLRLDACRCFSSSTSVTGSSKSLYEILGIPSTASVSEIKRAYRLRAMRCHPDSHANGRGSVSEFIAVSSAYEVLSDQSQRRMYDERQQKVQQRPADGEPPGASARRDRPVERKQKGEDHQYTSSWASRSWRGNRNRAEARAEEPISDSLGQLDPREVEKWRYEVGSWYLTRQASALDSRPGSSLGRYLDRYQREMEGDLRGALRQAYLGPSLHHLAPGQLPKHFEAEERTDPLSPNLLNLVSGRTLLGSVSLSETTVGEDLIRREETTDRDQDRHDLSPSIDQDQVARDHDQSIDYFGGHSGRLFGPAFESAFDPLRFLDPPDKIAADRASGEIVIKLLEEHKGGSDPSKLVLGGSKHRKKQLSHHQRETTTDHLDKDKEEHVSRRHSFDKEESTPDPIIEREEKDASDQEQPSSIPLDMDYEAVSSQGLSSSSSSPPLSPPPSSWPDSPLAMVGDILYMSLQGKPWARAIRDPPSGSPSSSSSRRIKVQLLHRKPPHDTIGILDDGIYDSLGKRTGHLIRLGLIGVHTIHVFDTSDQKIKLLCRLTRSHPLPPSTWLFPPRLTSHAGASWYVEWGGYMREGREGWLDPAVHLFLAAFATMDFEGRTSKGEEMKEGSKRIWERSKMLLGIW